MRVWSGRWTPTTVGKRVHLGDYHNFELKFRVVELHVLECNYVVHVSAGSRSAIKHRMVGSLWIVQY